MTYKLVPSVLLLLGLLTACNTSDRKVIKLAHGLDVNHSVHRAMVLMGEELERLSQGNLKLEIYPNQQLGTERECLELLQIGSLDMTKVSAGVMENFSPKMKVLGLPFLFRDRFHAFQVLDGEIGKNLLDDAEKYWLKGLCFYDAGSRSFYTKEKPVYEPSDLEGLKIRVMESATAMDMVRNLGGSPTPISWGELYTSLQQGVVDGAENNPPSFYLSRHYEVCKYYTLDEHTTLPDVLLIGSQTWNRLTTQEQLWLEKAVALSVRMQRKLWADSEHEALVAVIEAGVKIIQPDKDLFMKQVNHIYESYKGEPEFYRLIQSIQNVQ
jgi:tripartite ATP-independent transporter DctP family solute receptor